MSSMTKLTPALVDRVHKVKVADLADACRGLGFRGNVASPTLRPAFPYSSLVGVAMTVRCSIERGMRPYGDQAAELYGRGLTITRGVVVQRNDVPDFTSIGSGGARVAREHGYVGWITSGPIRDTDELREGTLPVYGTSIVPSGRLVTEMPAGRSIHFSFDETVDIASMSVRPGDVLVGDNDGVIALPPDRFEEVLAGAEEILRGEAALFRKIDQGLTYRQILDAAKSSSEGE
jgi:4-hydroxy-4-methyl-2-oxoglutarate aldolase